MFLNVRTPPFDDPGVRRALNYAVDRSRVAELLGGHDTQKPTCQLLPPGIQGYVPACRFTVNPNPAGTWIGPDLARAQRLVAASGTRGMEVEFWGTRPWPTIGRYFRSLLARLGYRARLRTFGELHLIFENAAGEPRPRPQLGLWGLGRARRWGELWQRAEISLADKASIVPLVNSSDISLTAGRIGNYQHHPLWGPLVEQLWVR